MAHYSLDELQQSLGSVFNLEPSRSGKVAQIRTKVGHELGFIDLNTERIEACLRCRWRTADTNPRGFSGRKDVAAARKKVVKELLPDWEAAGFRVDDDEPGGGVMVSDPKDKNSLPVFVLDVCKDVKTLEDAAKTIRWMRTASTETSAQDERADEIADIDRSEQQ